jgi:hypothetical protein
VSQHDRAQPDREQRRAGVVDRVLHALGRPLGSATASATSASAPSGRLT